MELSEGIVAQQGVVGVMLVGRVMLVIVLMYAMALWWHYGCVSGGMTGEVGGVTYMYGNHVCMGEWNSQKALWRSRGVVGVMLVRVLLALVLVITVVLAVVGVRAGEDG